MATVAKLNEQMNRLNEIIKEIELYVDIATNLNHKASALDKRTTYLAVIESLKDYKALKLKILERSQAQSKGEKPTDKGFDDYFSTL